MRVPMSKSASWQPFEGGSTLGLSGAQGGTISWDEEYGPEVRLTLEQDESRSFYALTCGVAGWLVHTRFFDSRDQAIAAFEQMRPALEELWSQLPREDPRRSREAARVGGERLSAFIVRFP
jgi:hypothetical protein